MRSNGDREAWCTPGTRYRYPDREGQSTQTSIDEGVQDRSYNEHDEAPNSLDVQGLADQQDQPGRLSSSPRVCFRLPRSATLTSPQASPSQLPPSPDPWCSSAIEDTCFYVPAWQSHTPLTDRSHYSATHTVSSTGTSNEAPQGTSFLPEAILSPEQIWALQREISIDNEVGRIVQPCDGIRTEVESSEQSKLVDRQAVQGTWNSLPTLCDPESQKDNTLVSIDGSIRDGKLRLRFYAVADWVSDSATSVKAGKRGKQRERERLCPAFYVWKFDVRESFPPDIKHYKDAGATTVTKRFFDLVTEQANRENSLKKSYSKFNSAKFVRIENPADRRKETNGPSLDRAVDKVEADMNSARRRVGDMGASWTLRGRLQELETDDSEGGIAEKAELRTALRNELFFQRYDRRSVRERPGSAVRSTA